LFIFLARIALGHSGAPALGVIIKNRRKAHIAQNRSDLHTAPKSFFDFSTLNDAFLSNFIDIPGKMIIYNSQNKDVLIKELNSLQNTR
jgi:hypothetical protein